MVMLLANGGGYGDCMMLVMSGGGCGDVSGEWCWLGDFDGE